MVELAHVVVSFSFSDNKQVNDLHRIVVAALGDSRRRRIES